MSLSDNQYKFLLALGKLLEWSAWNGFKVTGGELHRSAEQQKIYIETGRSRKKYSKHQDRLAIDLNVYVNGEYKSCGEFYRRIGEHWELLGGVWGGRFGVKKEHYTTKVGWDSNHFEWRR